MRACGPAVLRVAVGAEFVGGLRLVAGVPGRRGSA